MLSKENARRFPASTPDSPMNAFSLTAGDWLFAFKTAGAALLALFVAFRWNLPQPYWALLTVLIVAQPYTGMVRSKALYRFVGTFIGATMAVFLVPRLVNMPQFLTLALAAWIALCLYLSLIDGTPRSYAFILAGYTVALIGFPSVTSPQDIFPTAVARVEEVCLGILSTFVINEMFFPRSAVPLFDSRIRRWLEQFLGATLQILEAPPGSGVLESIRHRLSIDLAALDPLSVFAAYDTARSDHIGGMNRLRERIRELLPLLTEIVRHLEVLGREYPETMPSLRPLLEACRSWMEQTLLHAPLPFPDLLKTGEPPGPDFPEAADRLIRSLKTCLISLCRLWEECHDLRRDLRGNAVIPESPAPLKPPSSHRDHLLAGLSAVAVFITVVLVADFWILTEWPDGAIATMMAAVVGSFFAAMDDPVPAIVRFLSFMTTGSVLGILTLFILLPMAHNFLDLSLVLSLVLIPAALFLGKPEYAIPVLSFSIGFAGVLALSRSYSGHFAHSVNTAIAQNMGIFLMAIMTRLLRSVGADWSVRRLYRSDLSDLALLARPSPAPSSETENGEGQAALERIIDRTPQLAIRLQALTPEERHLYSQSFLHPSIGRILLDVSRLRNSLSGPHREHLNRFLDGLSEIFLRHPLPGQMSFSPLRKGIRSLEDALSSGHDPLHRSILERLTALETFIPPEDRRSSPLSATGGSSG